MHVAVQAIMGRTWAGIEFGEAPRSNQSFLEYTSTLRLGDVAEFSRIEHVDRDWWFITLDRGAGAALHFAAHHGQVCRDVAVLLSRLPVPPAVNTAPSRWKRTPGIVWLNVADIDMMPSSPHMGNDFVLRVQW